MIGKRVKQGNKTGIISGYIEWGGKVRHVWIRFDNDTETDKAVKVGKNVTIYK